jgi:hypothetical protein
LLEQCNTTCFHSDTNDIALPPHWPSIDVISAPNCSYRLFHLSEYDTDLTVMGFPPVEERPGPEGAAEGEDEADFASSSSFPAAAAAARPLTPVSDIESAAAALEESSAAALVAAAASIDVERAERRYDATDDDHDEEEEDEEQCKLTCVLISSCSHWLMCADQRQGKRSHFISGEGSPTLLNVAAWQLLN